MWVCFSDAFVSAVQDRKDRNRLIVRRRKEGHLHTLFPSREILLTPEADYAARVFPTRAEFASVVNERIAQFRYENFKASVTDSDLHNLYADFWLLHRQYQEMARRR